MLVCVWLLLPCLLSVGLLPLSDALRTPPRFTQHPGLRLASRLGPHPQKAREEMSEKLLFLDHLVRMENDVIEPKRKRSFPGGNTPLDRLSISAMDTKQASSKRKAVEMPRRRISPPMDRIGVSRLPNSRG
ncbi:hypothetical protein NHX12_008832 [Muraenolepis orangiensis]|uniref:Osteocrin n=1 Tax=Muraenolepis orangiensis TaxID=630683 RepID=A0A9Q0DKE4_9TELE|nr:hypothetical protein NHX12_008832 [Muraenolepis orangiensis]